MTKAEFKKCKASALSDNIQAHREDLGTSTDTLFVDAAQHYNTQYELASASKKGFYSLIIVDTYTDKIIDILVEGLSLEEAKKQIKNYEHIKGRFIIELKYLQ